MQPKNKTRKQIAKDCLNRKKARKVPCAVKDCPNIQGKENTYCVRHCQQMRMHGKILKRTMFDPNEFKIKGHILYMKVYDGKGKYRATVIMDAKDYDKVKDRKWSLNRHSEQVYSRVPNYTSLKRTLLNIEVRRKVTFKNKNKKDFRKANLDIIPFTHMKGRS